MSAKGPGDYVFMMDNISSPKKVFVGVFKETSNGIYDMKRYDMSIVGDLGYINFAKLHGGHLFFVGETYELLGFTLGFSAPQGFIMTTHPDQ